VKSTRGFWLKISRREVTKILLAAAVAPHGLAANAASQAAAAKTWDVAIIGAGVFGAWSAYWLRKDCRDFASAAR